MRQFVASSRRNAEDTIARLKMLADAADSFLNDPAVGQEELRPEDGATFATILFPLETLDVKKVVSEGNNMVKPAEDELLYYQLGNEEHKRRLRLVEQKELGKLGVDEQLLRQRVAMLIMNVQQELRVARCDLNASEWETRAMASIQRNRSRRFYKLELDLLDRDGNRLDDRDYAQDLLDNERLQEKQRAKVKRLCSVLDELGQKEEAILGWTEPEDQLPETAFATTLSPLETLDVKEVVSKGDNVVVSYHELARADQKLAVPLQEPEILLNSFSLGGGDALLDSGKDKAPTKEELAVDSFQDPEILRDILSLGSVGAMKHMHDRWKWRWKLPVLQN